MIHLTYCAAQDEWNATLAQLPKAHVLQSWEWGEFKSRYGWQPSRLMWLDGTQPCAAALVLSRRFNFNLPQVMYVPKGPALDYGNLAVLERVLGDLEESARQRRALFIKIDPDVQSDTAEGKIVVEVLRRRGWRASREQIQFRNTILLDLTHSLDELLAAMKPKWRYNIRLAARKGVTVRPGTLDDLPLLYRLYAETALRDGFVIRPQAYYRDAWGTFIEAGLAWPFIAEVEGTPVAMAIVFHFADRAWYMYGASSRLHRDRMPNHLIQWEALRWAQGHGCTVYDFWGAPEKLEPSDPLWGVYRFKQGFGGELVRYIGAWDFPVSGAGYLLYTFVVPHLLSIMRWRYWRAVCGGKSGGKISQV